MKYPIKMLYNLAAKHLNLSKLAPTDVDKAYHLGLSDGLSFAAAEIKYALKENNDN